MRELLYNTAISMKRDQYDSMLERSTYLTLFWTRLGAHFKDVSLSRRKAKEYHKIQQVYAPLLHFLSHEQSEN